MPDSLGQAAHNKHSTKASPRRCLAVIPEVLELNKTKSCWRILRNERGDKHTLGMSHAKSSGPVVAGFLHALSMCARLLWQRSGSLSQKTSQVAVWRMRGYQWLQVEFTQREIVRV